jgi:hypothetical protein
MKTSIFFGLLVLVTGCSSGTIVQQGTERAPVMNDWENLYIYFSPPENYQVIGMVTGKGHGFGDQSKMENAMEGMEEQAREAGATGVLVQSAGMSTAGAVSTSSWQGNGSGGYAFGAAVPLMNGSVSGLAIYVPADAANYTQALQIHESVCGTLSTNEESTKAAVDSAKKSGVAADINTAKHNLDAVKDEEDSNYCGRDAWYAKQMEAQQQLLDKMRAEAASQAVDKKAAEATHDEECLAAAKNNDLDTWRKLNCK